VKASIYLPGTATKSARYPLASAVTRSQYARAARDLHRQGLTPRDIGEALKLGTAAAAQLLKPSHAS